MPTLGEAVGTVWDIATSQTASWLKFLTSPPLTPDWLGGLWQATTGTAQYAETVLEEKYGFEVPSVFTIPDIIPDIPFLDLPDINIEWPPSLISFPDVSNITEGVGEWAGEYVDKALLLAGGLGVVYILLREA